VKIKKISIILLIFFTIISFSIITYNNLDKIKTIGKYIVKRAINEQITNIRNEFIKENDLVKKNYFFQRRSNLANDFLLYKDKYKLNLKKISLPETIYERPGGYSDVFENNLLIVRGNGEIFNYNKNKLFKIDSNLKDFINQNVDEGYLVNAVRDFKIFDKEIFVVLIGSKFEPHETECCDVINNKLTPIILKADIDGLSKKFLDFKIFFKTNEYSKENSNPDHGGGKIYKIKGEFYFAVPDHGEELNGPQNKDSIFGKVIKILDNQNYEIITSGHRNPQGLIYIPKYDIILNSEHGPMGGDEINLLIKGKNYGWPISSLGIADNVKNNDHKANGFVEPLYFWKINPGVSELAYIPYNSNLPFRDTVLVSSLSGSKTGPTEYTGNHIYIFKFKDNKLVEDGKIFLDDRIRDLTYDPLNDHLIALLEDQSKLLIIDFKNN